MAGTGEVNGLYTSAIYSTQGVMVVEGTCTGGRGGADGNFMVLGLCQYNKVIHTVWW